MRFFNRFFLFVFFLCGSMSYAIGAQSADEQLSSFEEAVFNVKDYGALGDGVANDAPAIQAAIDSASVYGGGIVLFPAGNYRLAAPLVPKSNITLQGSGLGAVLMATTAITSAIGQPTGDLANFTVERLTFRGGVIVEGEYPRNSRRYTPSFTSAISLMGSRVPDSDYPVISNVIVRECNLLQVRGLPVFFQGITDRVLVTNCFMDNCLDPGFIFCESVQFIANSVRRGADNGVSVSRGCVKAVIADNVFEDVAYWGVWCSGFNNQFGPESFTITGNVMRRCGYGGVALLNGPINGTVSGNTIDTVFNGPVDKQTKVQGRGIWITPYAVGGEVIHEASQILISGNLFRNIARGGISLSGASDILISGNSFIDVGATDTIASKVNYNSGIYTDDFNTPGAGLNRVGVVGNTFVDTREVPFSNFAYAPAIRTSTNSYQKNNTMIGYRQPLDEPLHVGGNTDDNQFVSINGKAGVLRELLFQTAGVRRWDLRVSNTAESGSQAGSDFSIIRRLDNGAVGGYPLIITRSDGSMRLVEASGKLGFFNAAPVPRQAAIPDTSGATVTELENEINKLKALIRAYGLMAE